MCMRKKQTAGRSELSSRWLAARRKPGTALTKLRTILTRNHTRKEISVIIPIFYESVTSVSLHPGVSNRPGRMYSYLVPPKNMLEPKLLPRPPAAAPLEQSIAPTVHHSSPDDRHFPPECRQRSRRRRYWLCRPLWQQAKLAPPEAYIELHPNSTRKS